MHNIDNSEYFRHLEITDFREVKSRFDQLSREDIKRLYSSLVSENQRLHDYIYKLESKKWWKLWTT